MNARDYACVRCAGTGAVAAHGGFFAHRCGSCCGVRKHRVVCVDHAELWRRGVAAMLRAGRAADSEPDSNESLGLTDRKYAPT